MDNILKTWYTNSRTTSTQGLIYEEDTGKNIAVSYDVKDAPLIAAAPELLEACKKIVDSCEVLFKKNGFDYHLSILQDAINKAEGK